MDAQAKGPVLTGVVVVAQDVEAARTIAGIRKGAASAELEDQIFESATRLGKLVASQRSSDALASYLINDVLAPHLRAIGAWKPNGTLEVDFGRCAGCTVQADGRTARSLAPGERARFERVPAGSHRIEVSLAGRSLALCPVDIEAAKQTRLSIDACAKTSNAMEKDRVLTWVGGAMVVAGATALIASAVLASATPTTLCLGPSAADCTTAVSVGGQSISSPTFDRDAASGAVPLNAIGGGLLAAGTAWAIGNEWVAPDSPGWVWTAGFLAGAAGAAIGATVR
ncbi:MAG: hypothetical protein AAFN74_13665 [Myxococcota bacterium]